jgi:hypothetical protein
MERRNFIRSAGAAGITAIGLSTAGCMGGGESSGAGEGQNENVSGDEPINAEGNNSQNPAWFNIDVNVLEEKAGQEAQVTQSGLFRTSTAFGVRFTVVNNSGAPLTNVTVNARLLDANGNAIGTYSTALTEQESIGDLGVGEQWQGDIIFDSTNPGAFFDQVASYEIWASAQAESGGVNASGDNDNPTSGNTTGGNMTGNMTNSSG